MDKLFSSIATRVSHATGQPATFVIAVLAILGWAITGPIFDYSDTWQLIVNTSTTIITFLMVFIIQNSQNRDGAAVQAKLDELIRAVAEARDDFIGIEHLSTTELQAILAEIEREVQQIDGKASTGPASIKTLIRRV
jgi:low affinity Fe/Cu permease